MIIMLEIPAMQKRVTPDMWKKFDVDGFLCQIL